jgi:glucose/arabinose dehydrogenase
MMTMKSRLSVCLAGALMLLAGGSASDLYAQQRTPNTGVIPNVPGQALLPEEREVFDSAGSTLGDGPWEYDLADYRVKVSKVTGGLERPWGMVFLPNGDVLVSERAGRLRLIHNGVLDPKPITGIPKVLFRDVDGLMDIELHPNFAKNKLVYFTYAKPDRDNGGTAALGRGRYDGGYELKDVEELFVAYPFTPRRQIQSATSRMVFGRDGKIYMTIGNPNMDRLKAQDPSSHRGKVVRLNDDGTAPADNPFVNKTDYGIAFQPEIYSLGHRNPNGITVHPVTGAIWEVENGPQGGDELNLIEAGKNYGWPVISMGREYDGRALPFQKEGMETPFLFWAPTIGTSSVMFYSGDKFPKWKGNAFVSALIGAHIERIQFNDKGLPISTNTRTSRENLLYDLDQRIREVVQGPDGNLYAITDYAKGAALLKIEPLGAPSKSAAQGAKGVQ